MTLKADERLDKLMSVDLDIIQSPSVFSFSIDALFLADFAQVPSRANAKIVDLCSGNGVIPLLLSQRTASPIVGIEIQERLVDMARRSVALNALDEQITIIHGDLKQATDWIPHDSVDVLTVNPPYFLVDETSRKNPNEHLAIARHELFTHLDEVLKVSADLLKMRGRFFMVHRPDRFLEILAAMKANRLMPKKVQFVYPKTTKEANMLLIEGIKDGKETGFKVLPPIIVHDEEGNYRPAIREMFYGKE